MFETTVGAPASVRTTSSGLDIGSAMTIVFSDRSWKVLVGHSHGDRVWKFPCGKIEERDCPEGESVPLSRSRFLETASQQCAMRELYAETGIRETQLAFMHKLKYVREWTARDRVSRSEKLLRQFHFVAVVSEDVELPEDVLEGDEMDIRAFWDMTEVFKRAMQPRFTKDKFNPFHALALVEAIIFLKNAVGNDPAFRVFHEKLNELQLAQLHIDTLSYEIDDQIKNLRI